MPEQGDIQGGARRALAGRNLVLVGFMGTGKTAVGRKLAQLLDWPFVDTDEAIERQVKMAVPTIFARQGEAAFRDIEQVVLAQLAEQTGQVIATGGGALGRVANRERLRASGLLVALTARPAVILERVGGAKAAQRRPMLAGPDPRAAIERLLREREPVYGAADLTVDSSDLPPQAVAQRILWLIARASPN